MDQLNEDRTHETKKDFRNLSSAMEGNLYKSCLALNIAQQFQKAFHATEVSSISIKGG